MTMERIPKKHDTVYWQGQQGFVIRTMAPDADGVVMVRVDMRDGGEVVTVPLAELSETPPSHGVTHDV